MKKFSLKDYGRRTDFWQKTIVRDAIRMRVWAEEGRAKNSQAYRGKGSTDGKRRGLAREKLPGKSTAKNADRWGDQ